MPRGSISSSGSAYERRAPNEVLPLLDEVLAGRRQLLGEEHPRTLDVCVGKAAVSFSLALFQRLTPGQERKLGVDNSGEYGPLEPNPLARQIAAGHAELLSSLLQEVRQALAMLRATVAA